MGFADGERQRGCGVAAACSLVHAVVVIRVVPPPRLNIKRPVEHGRIGDLEIPRFEEHLLNALLRVKTASVSPHVPLHLAQGHGVVAKQNAERGGAACGRGGSVPCRRLVGAVARRTVGF